MADVFKTYEDIVNKHGDIDIRDIYNKGSFAIRSAYFKDKIIRDVSKYYDVAKAILNSGHTAECLYYVAHAPNGGYEVANNILEEICYIIKADKIELKDYLEEKGFTNDVMNSKSEKERKDNLSEVEELLDMFEVGKKL